MIVFEICTFILIVLSHTHLGDSPRPYPTPKPYISPLRAEELTYAETVREMSEVLERPVQYKQIDFEAFEKGLIASGRRAFLAQHLKRDAIYHSNGIFAGKNDVVEKLTGRKPQTVREFVLKNKGMFSWSSTQGAPS